MKTTVWDTHVTRRDGTTMHFDIIVPESQNDTATIYGYGREYLKTKGQEGQPLTAQQSKFCHVEAAKPEWEETLRKQGYHIIEMAK